MLKCLHNVEAGIDARAVIEGAVIGDTVHRADTALGESAVDLLLEELKADDVELGVDPRFKEPNLDADELFDEIQLTL